MQLLSIAPAGRGWMDQVCQYLGEGALTKTLRIMRLTVILLTAFCVQVSAKTWSQKVTYSAQNVPLETVLQEIKKQTGFTAVYKAALLKESKPVTVSADDLPLAEFMNILLKDQPLKFSIRRNTIILEKREEREVSFIGLQQSAPPVTGIVRGPDEQPLAGVNIIVKGTKRGTISKADGSFSIEAKEGEVLLISSIGFLERQVGIGASPVIGIIALTRSDSKLDEIQIIAYGQTSKRYSTSNISSVKANEIERQPVTNPLLTLQGRVPGMFIQQGSGVSGAGIKVIIQGLNSMAKGNVPFYVIDGVPYNPDGFNTPATASSLTSAGATSNLTFINPADIESIEVLKDADATSIYGSRAANGAILITTKKGKAGQTKVEFNLQNGWSKVTRTLDMVNRDQYLALRHEAKLNANAAIGDADYDINGVWDTTRNTDWQKELLGGTAKYQNLQLSISGGTDRTQFLFSAGYLNETTVFPGDYSNKKANINFNISHSSLNQRFRFFMSANYLQGLNKVPQTDLTGAAITLSPVAPALYNADGSVNWGPHPTIANSYTFLNNPIAGLSRTFREKANNLVSSAQLSYEIASGLSLKSSFGFNRLTSDELGILPKSSVNPIDRPSASSAGEFGYKSIQSWLIEPQLNFQRVTQFGNIETLLGSTFQQTENSMLSLSGSGYNSEAQISDINAAGTKNVTGSMQSVYKYDALFGRINYRFRDRYIVNLSARRDGSSRFGVENQLHNFYSVAGAWILSQERFINKALPFLSFAKFRGSYGTTGNDQIGDYAFYSLYTNYAVDLPYQNTIGLLPEGLPNPYLQWEETRKLNIGLDLGVWKNRVLINANFFRNRSSNQLLNQSLPTMSGFGGITRNLPATVQNKGLELTLNVTPIKGRDFTWQFSANITVPKNKLIRYDSLAESLDANKYVIGEPISVRKSFEFAGVDPSTGLYQFRTAKGTLTATPNAQTDRIALFSLDPHWYGGFSNSFSYKNFDLDVFFQFVKKLTGGDFYTRVPGVNVNENQLAVILDHWRKPGDQAPFQKVTTNFGEVLFPWLNVLSSNANVTDASYLRLKNVALSYTFNPQLVKKAHLVAARVFVQGQNLLTFTKFRGPDPETGAWKTLRTMRTVSAGIKVTF